MNFDKIDKYLGYLVMIQGVITIMAVLGISFITGILGGFLTAISLGVAFAPWITSIPFMVGLVSIFGLGGIYLGWQMSLGTYLESRKNKTEEILYIGAMIAGLFSFISIVYIYILLRMYKIIK